MISVKAGAAIVAVIMAFGGVFLIVHFSHWAVAVGVVLLIWSNNIK